jgi:hypothetical protein
MMTAGEGAVTPCLVRNMMGLAIIHRTWNFPIMFTYPTFIAIHVQISNITKSSTKPGAMPTTSQNHPLSRYLRKPSL